MASETQLFTNYKNCAEKGGTDCEELSFQTSPEFEAITKRIQNAEVTRNRGTERTSSDEPIGYWYLNQSALTGQSPEVNTATAQLGQNIKFNFAASTTESPPNAQGESIVEVDDGNTNRENSNNEGSTQSQLTNAVKEDKLILDGGNKAYPFITPLANTNITGLKLAPPHGDIDNGAEGNIYDVSLLEDEGIIYLRQYLSFDDEETGAVWRFQYAPQIAWSASATFQEDKSWGTNVQPSHFSNKSGKKVTIQGAILEGMTIGKTVTGAVLALESLMSVANPDNQLQVAPYAYRLIIGKRTVTEPISGRHAPFVIEQITVKEEMYDTEGEMISVKIDLTLKEIPYYQINDGRKLLIVTEDRADNVVLNCERISDELAKLEGKIKQLAAQNNTAIDEYLTSIRVTLKGTQESASLSGKELTSEINGRAAEGTMNETAGYLNTVQKNCNEHSDNYFELAKLYREYSAKKCTTTRPTEGLKIIERLFASDSGLYEILLGKRTTSQQNRFFIGKVFDESGERLVDYQDRLNRLNWTDQNEDYEFLNSVNKFVTRPTDGERKRLLGDRLIDCNHIHCNSVKTAGTTAENNLQPLTNILTWLCGNNNNYRDYVINLSNLKGTLSSAESSILGGSFGTINQNQIIPGTSTEARDYVTNLVRNVWGFEDVPSVFPVRFTVFNQDKLDVAPFVLPGAHYAAFFNAAQEAVNYNAVPDGRYLGIVNSNNLHRLTFIELRKVLKIVKDDFEYIASGKAAEYEAIKPFFAEVFFGTDNPDPRLVSLEWSIAYAAQYLYLAVSDKNKVLRRRDDLHGSCNTEALAAQDIGTYEQLVVQMASALRTFLQQTDEGLGINTPAGLVSQINDETVNTNKRVCPGFKENTKGRAQCLAGYSIAKAIFDIILFFEDKGFRNELGIRNPFGESLTANDVHGVLGR